MYISNHITNTVTTLLMAVFLTAQIGCSMGESIPPKPPEPIDSEKYYCVEVDIYNIDGCIDLEWEGYRCCQQGDQLLNWIAGNIDCVTPFELCVYSGTTNQRLIDWVGPYDIRDDCLSVCQPDPQ